MRISVAVRDVGPGVPGTAYRGLWWPWSRVSDSRALLDHSRLRARGHRQFAPLQRLMDDCHSCRRQGRHPGWREAATGERKHLHRRIEDAARTLHR